MTSMAMWLQYHGIATLPPPEMIAALRGSGAMSGAYLKYNTPHLTLTFPNAVEYDGWMMRDNPQMIVKLRQFVKSGNPVCARVDFNPRTNAHEQHWIIVTESKDDDFWIVDPHLGRGGWVSELYGISGTDIIECLFYRVKSGFKRQKIGIDLSKWNEITSYTDFVKKDNVEFAFVRAAYGTTKDLTFHTHCNGLSSAKIAKLGAYFFLVSDEDKHPIDQQVKTWIQIWNERDDLTAFAVDVEDGHLAHEQVKRCYDLLKSYNLPLIDYSSKHKWGKLTGNLDTGNPKWLALYPRKNFNKPARADIWQYSEYGTLHGCKSIDLNLLISDWPSRKSKTVNVWDLLTGGTKSGEKNRPRMIDVLDDNGEKIATERYQEQVEDNKLYIVKNSQWECYEKRGDFIHQVRDTSPAPSATGGIPHYYDSNGIYCPVEMELDKIWEEPSPHYVGFYRKSDGVRWDASPSGWARNRAVLRRLKDGMYSFGNPDGEMHILKKGVGRAGWTTPPNFQGEAKSAWLSADTTDDYPNVREIVASPKKKRM